ncbi:Cytochrome P450 4F12 [Leucoagaricus sp. SymC.cos]|nr:Cytochrome P450 4F12 [Leucoagaricus sp. SymC.cos]
MTYVHLQLEKRQRVEIRSVLIFGALDTTSATLSRILWQLSRREDIQEKIRQEIQELQNERGIDRLSYEDLSNLPWLDALVKETLRLYPPVPFVRRVATRDCAVPYMQGDELVYVTIPKGTIVFVGIAGSNRSEQVWGPDAGEWKPERWTESGNSKGKERLPGVYAGM